MAVETNFPPNDGIFSNHDLFDDGASDGSCEEAASQSEPVTTENETLVHEKLKGKTQIVKIRKPKKLDTRKMHSETQRIIRESTVNLPKYQTKIKTLDGFLSKITQKKKTPFISRCLSSCDKENDNSNNNVNLLKSSFEEDDAEQYSTCKPLPVSTPSIHPFDSVVMNTKQEPIEKLKTSFLKHATLSRTNHSKIIKLTEDATNTVETQDEVSQHGLAPGVIRQKLKRKLLAEMARTKAQERRELEKIRKLENEEIDDELTELETKLMEEQQLSSDSDEEEEWKLSFHKRNNEKEEDNNDWNCSDSDHEKPCSIVSEGFDDNVSGDIDSNDEEVYFVPAVSKRNRIIDSDDDDCSDNGRTNSQNEGIESFDQHKYNLHNNMTGVVEESGGSKQNLCDLSDDTKQDSCDNGTVDSIPLNNTLEESCMGPLVFTGTLGQEDSLDYPIGKTQPICTPVNEDSQLTDLVNDEDEYYRDMSYQIGPSLPPPHQVPRVARDESDELFMTTPSITRQSSTVSDKDVLRGLEAHPIRIATQLPTQGMLDEETQFLDANGFLSIRNRTKVESSFSAIRQLADMNSKPLRPSSQLLALCSGDFQPNKTLQKEERFSIVDSTLNNDDNTTDLLGLCSGIFPTTTNTTQGLSQHHLVTSDSEEEDNMPLIKRRRKLHGEIFTNSKRLLDFVESEAELSGSDIEEDDEDDGVSEDSYEVDEGSDIQLSDNELRNQVNKVHIKQLVADDKADIRNIQERFLLEGDLYEDGLQMRNGFFRTRRFIHDSEASQDLFAEDRNLDIGIDEESLAIGSQAEAKRRKERLEKDEFLKRSTENNNSLLQYDEDSQSILELIKETSISTPLQNKTPNTSNNVNIKIKRGSFLKHKSRTLQRLVSVGSTPQGLGSGRGFVFQTCAIEVDKVIDKAKTIQKPQKKKPCYSRSISLPAASSIFDQLK